MLCVCIYSPVRKVGKTVIATHLAYALSQQGRSVLLIDLSSDLDVAKRFGIKRPRPGMASIDAPLSAAIRQVRPGLCIVSYGSTGRLPAPLKCSAISERYEKTVSEMSQIEHGFDVVLFDASSTWSPRGNTFFHADRIIIPLSLKKVSMGNDNGALIGVNQTVRMWNAPDRFMLALNFFEYGNSDHEDVADRLCSQYPNSTFPISYSEHMQGAEAQGKLVGEIVADDAAMRDVDKIVERLNMPVDDRMLAFA